MKTAEQFKHSIGKADEAFVHGIRQTLAKLECKEEKPVKKKISMGLVLAAAIMLLTVTAVAAGQWGIVSFLEERGDVPGNGVLLTEMPPQASQADELVQVTIEEALSDGERLYLAVTAKALKDKTLVVPYVNDIAAEGTMSVMNNPDYDKTLSVQEYAEKQGCDYVVTLYMHEQLIHTSSNQSKDKFTGLEYAYYDHMEDGTLRMILQYGYEVDEDYGYPERLDMVVLGFVPWEHSAESRWMLTHDSSQVVNVMADLAFYISEETRRSINEDAHDIVGYRGAVEYVTFTPYNDEKAAVSILVDMTKRGNDETWMSGPDYVLVDEAGNPLCKVELAYGYDVFVGQGEPRLYHGTIPAEFMPKDKVTIRLQSWRNYNIIYDEYTYTLK